MIAFLGGLTSSLPGGISMHRGTSCKSVCLPEHDRNATSVARFALDSVHREPTNPSFLGFFVVLLRATLMV